MKILHISMECYPAAKAGGLGDVAGALPVYLNKLGTDTAIIIPKYRTKWLVKQEFKELFRGAIRLNQVMVPFSVQKVMSADLGYEMFVADIPGLLDRADVYLDENGQGWRDEVERHLCFQQAVLYWVMSMEGKPQVLHCHDHHTGFIPFMVKHCPEYRSLANIPTIFTIHNGEYHGAFSWSKEAVLPYYDANARGLLDWNNTINPLATAIKTCWKLTTVSPGYLQELYTKSNGLEGLIRGEAHKSKGILNGIDTNVWNPKKDKFLASNLKNSIKNYKDENKTAVLRHFKIVPDVPIVTFIGRLVREKGADIIPGVVRRILESGRRVGFIVLGTGAPSLHHAFRMLKHEYIGFFDAALEYNEGLAHQLYAGSDYLLMPSRVEPCGLNQMYACRYGTVPIVRSVGGLRNSIPDIGEPDGSGRGIRFDNFTLDDAALSVFRAADAYENQDFFQELRQRIMAVDFSWEHSAQTYLDIYKELGMS